MGPMIKVCFHAGDLDRPYPARPHPVAFSMIKVIPIEPDLDHSKPPVPSSGLPPTPTKFLVLPVVLRVGHQRR